MPITTVSAPVDAAPEAGAAARKSRRRRGGSGPHPIDVHAGSRLRLRRMVLGMSQGTLGERVGLTFQQIQKYERGANRMGASRLYELATVLDVPISYFFDALPGGAVGKPSRLPSPEMEKHDLRFLSAYLGITDRNIRKSLYDLVRAIGGTAPAGR